MHIEKPKNVMFAITSMPVGGAETLLANMMYRFDPNRIRPSVCCLKHKDELGERIADDFPVYSDLIKGKFDVGVVARLKRLFKKQAIDAVVTIGAGDKMFWGRLAARYANVPVVLSALHSTGWPDGVGHLNRLLTGITNGFIAVAKAHGEHLIQHEKFPREKVFVIPNGVDTDKFQYDCQNRKTWRAKLGIPDASPTVGIVAALRPEKNHAMFVRVAKKVLNDIPDAHFVIVGDGPERQNIESLISELGIEWSVHLTGCTHEIPAIMSTIDLFTLTSRNEANPVSILEAMSCQRPVVCTNVGSVKESVIHGRTGYVVSEGDEDDSVARWVEILSNRDMAASMGNQGRDHVLANSSLDTMTEGYTYLIETLYDLSPQTPLPLPESSATAPSPHPIS